MAIPSQARKTLAPTLAAVLLAASGPAWAQQSCAVTEVVAGLKAPLRLADRKKRRPRAPLRCAARADRYSQ